MSRSRRKTPIFGITTARSEREDKALWHGRWRAAERTVLAAVLPGDADAHMTTLARSVSDPWGMAKDGRRFWSLEQRTTAAGRVVRAGRSQAERAAIELRALRRFMAK
ncbi:MULTISPECIES: hypothetical protein [unclassified Acidovorax]|uniref:hypothetical protein n=1 Tax=unclassified Acidovorax TaxID=2684926 RepID=UPI001C48EB6E|nr:MULTISPECIES: hypothetical protein [unclassified Acidovorax]MBV7428082.1 hypothetical protein [Acidovorax sp. sif0732]MBV7449339.1 hypothetical protein [Acidovorax sp. sif0715]